MSCIYLLQMKSSLLLRFKDRVKNAMKYVRKLFKSCYRLYWKVNVCILKYVIPYLRTWIYGNVCKTQPKKSWKDWPIINWRLYGARGRSYLLGVLGRGLGLQNLAAQKILGTLIKLLEVKIRSPFWNFDFCVKMRLFFLKEVSVRNEMHICIQSTVISD